MFHPISIKEESAAMPALEPETEIVTVSLPPEEYSLVEDLARKREVPLATVARALVLQVLEETTSDDPTVRDTAIDTAADAKRYDTEQRRQRAKASLGTKGKGQATPTTRMAVTVPAEAEVALYQLATAHRTTSGLVIRSIIRQRLSKDWPHKKAVADAVDQEHAIEIERRRTAIHDYRPWEGNIK